MEVGPSLVLEGNQGRADSLAGLRFPVLAPRRARASLYSAPAEFSTLLRRRSWRPCRPARFKQVQAARPRSATVPAPRCIFSTLPAARNGRRRRGAHAARAPRARRRAASRDSSAHSDGAARAEPCRHRTLCEDACRARTSVLAEGATQARSATERSATQAKRRACARWWQPPDAPPRRGWRGGARRRRQRASQRPALHCARRLRGAAPRCRRIAGVGAGVGANGAGRRGCISA